MADEATEDAAPSRNAGTVMLVEDEAFIALDLARQLTKAGYEILGPFSSATRALAGLEGDRPDVAVLDFTLAGSDTSEPVAAYLAERSIPFAFLTGYSATDRIDATPYADRPRLSKPCKASDVVKVLSALLGVTEPSPSAR